MIDAIETLNLLKQYRTMGRVATTMRITQSTVSKRIKSLEDELGKKLIYQQGRHVLLTEEANVFLDSVMPHIVGIKDAIGSVEAIDSLNLDIGFSESILSSWGAQVITKVSQEFPNYIITPHAHRGPVVIDRVRSGDYLFGVCAGDCEQAKDLAIIELGKEKMVFVGNPIDKKLPLMTVEPQSETWKSISRQAHEYNIFPDRYVEFFTPVAKLAKAGAVRGLVPIGVARENPELNVKRARLERSIVLITRKSTMFRTEMEEFINFLLKIFESTLKELNK